MNGKTVGKLLVALGALGLFGGFYQTYWRSPVPNQPQPSLSTTAAQSCQVLKIYDGDTIGCDMNGDHRIQRPDEMVRLIGIDAPEMHYSKKNKTHVDQPYAVEALRFVEGKTLHQTVYLEMDQRPRDHYGRLLAYVALAPQADQTLNEMLLVAGYADILFIPPNEKYRDRFEVQEHQAHLAHKGIWRLAETGPS